MTDLTKKIIGFRGWSVGKGEHGLTLGSTAVGHTWEPGVNEATCGKDSRSTGGFLTYTMTWQGGGTTTTTSAEDAWYTKFHQAPAANCDCGFYAVHSLDGAERWNGAQSVMGAVTAWGRIEAHHEGFRAQFVQPVLLALPSEVVKNYPYAAELLRECAARYGCGIVKPEELGVAAKEFGDSIPESLLPEKPKPPEPRNYLGAGHYYLSVPSLTWTPPDPEPKPGFWKRIWGTA